MNKIKLSGVERLNKEAGAKPALSRSCKVEQALKMSLGNWEGKACEETEPEELPERLKLSVLRVTGSW